MVSVSPNSDNPQAAKLKAAQNARSEGSKKPSSGLVKASKDSKNSGSDALVSAKPDSGMDEIYAKLDKANKIEERDKFTPLKANYYLAGLDGGMIRDQLAESAILESHNENPESLAARKSLEVDENTGKFNYKGMTGHNPNFSDLA